MWAGFDCERRKQRVTLRNPVWAGLDCEPRKRQIAPRNPPVPNLDLFNAYSCILIYVHCGTLHGRVWIVSPGNGK